MLRAVALLLPCLGFVALPALAETYKWVDERGVVNYSNSPPPGAAGKAASKVDERLSQYESAPASKLVPDPTIAYNAEAEWLQRQRLMAQRASSPQPCAWPAGPLCYDESAYDAYPYPYAVVPVVRAHARFVPQAPRHMVRRSASRSFR